MSAAVNHGAGLHRINHCSSSADWLVWAVGGVRWRAESFMHSMHRWKRALCWIIYEVNDRLMWLTEWRRVRWWRCNGVNSAHQPPSEQQLAHRCFIAGVGVRTSHTHEKHPRRLHDMTFALFRQRIYLTLTFCDRCVCDDCGVKRVMCVNAAESDAILIRITIDAHHQIRARVYCHISVIVFTRHGHSFISICVQAFH